MIKNYLDKFIHLTVVYSPPSFQKNPPKLEKLRCNSKMNCFATKISRSDYTCALFFAYYQSTTLMLTDME